MPTDEWAQSVIAARKREAESIRRNGGIPESVQAEMRWRSRLTLVAIAVLSMVMILVLIGPALAQTAIDGDTLRMPDGERVRLLGVDTPETHRPECLAEAMLGALATRYTASRLSEGVTLRREGEDRYGRTLARVYVGGEDLAAALIREGLATEWRGKQTEWCK